MADRHRVRNATGSVEQVQQEAGGVGNVARGFGVVQAQRGLPERARRGGHQGPGEQRGGVAVHVPGEHPDHVGVVPDDRGQRGRVVEDHAVEERDPDRDRRVVQADEGGHVAAGAEDLVDPGELGGAEASRRAALHPGVREHQGGLRVLHRVGGRHAVAEVRRVAETGDQGGWVVVVAREQVHRHRAGPQDRAQRGVLVRMAGVGQVAGDDHAVRPRLQCEQAGQCVG